MLELFSTYFRSWSKGSLSGAVITLLPRYKFDECVVGAGALRGLGWSINSTIHVRRFSQTNILTPETVLFTVIKQYVLGVF